LEYTSRLSNSLRSTPPFVQKVFHSLQISSKVFIDGSALLRMGNFPIYIEDPCGRGKGKYCDITIYTPNWKKSLWIEIKATGWCNDGEYKRCVKSDARKLVNLSRRGAKKYLLVTSIEDEKQNKAELEAWFRGFQEMAFDPNLFGFLASQDFKEGRKVIEGYYPMCLLRVKA
jgi:hypothetical protein